VRLRKAASRLEALGLTNDKIAMSAKRLERARTALEAATSALQTAAGLDVHGGMFASLDARVLQGAAEDLRLRLMARLIAAFGGQDAPARLAKLESLVARLSEPAFAAATLGGCVVTRKADDICVFREPGRAGLPEIGLAPGDIAIWDRRFRVEVGPELGAPVVVRALGGPGFASLRQQCKDRPPPARAAATLPSFWQDGVLLAVPQLAAAPSAPAASAKGRHCSAEFLW
jgi:tRNA(Ile)-lysidine synthase